VGRGRVETAPRMYLELQRLPFGQNSHPSTTNA
jgi:hypothetical protein